MSLADSRTLQALPAPTVLAISCAPDLVARCAQAVEALGVGLKECGFIGAATAVAEQRPLVMVLVDDVYAFDPEEFDALARDVLASLVRVEENIPAAKLEMLLEVALDAAAQRRTLPVDPPAAAAAPPSSRRDDAPRSSRDDAPRSSRRIGRRVPSQASLVLAVRPDTPPPSRPGTGGL
jgi:hypothetical protein